MSEQEDEDLITEGMVKKATYLIHKLAERRGADFGEIQKKCKILFAYTNLAKVTMSEGHVIINKLLELTGGEEEKEKEKKEIVQLPVKPDEGIKKHVTDTETPKKEEQVEEDDAVTVIMRQAIRAAVDITLKEVVEKDVPVQGLGGFVLEVGKVIFEAKMHNTIHDLETEIARLVEKEASK